MDLLRHWFPSLKSGNTQKGGGQDEENETLMPSSQFARTTKWSRKQRLWMSLIGLGGLAILLAIALVFTHRHVQVSSDFEPGWKTTIGRCIHCEPYPTLSIIQKRFRAGLDLDEDGNLTVVGGVPGEPQFVGQPTDEMDRNWNLFQPSETNITREEALQIGGEFYFYPGTDIATVVFSTFHILHCLDEIRKSVYPQHYWPDGVPELQRIHVDHCIDIIREYIMCHVDLTPISVVWSKNKGGLLPDFNQVHTCRSLDEAFQWVLHRNVASYEHGIGDDGVADHSRYLLKQFGWT